MKQTKSKRSKSRRVEIYDTTLRDGAQAQGIAFSLEDKLQIAIKLDELGVDYIEGGYPLSNAKDEAFFKQISQKKLKHSKIVSFGMTRKKGVKPSDDICLRALFKSQSPVVTIVGKSWAMQVRKVLAATLEENIRMVADSVRYLTRKGREVFFDAEHFFDGYIENPKYALKVLTAAAEAGATCLILCDTNGGTLESDLVKIVADIHNQIDVPIGIHTHDDSGLAVANTLAAVSAGACHVQGTMNGFGERCGNADLCTVISNLVLKMGYQCLQKNSLAKLTEMSRYVYEVANVNPPLCQPYVGASSFAHKGGMHVHAVSKSSCCYEHISPESVGNSRRVIISELSGASNLLARSEKLAFVEDKALVRKVLKHVQDLENEGYQFEMAEASFDLIVRRFMKRYHSFFELDHYRTVIFKGDSGEAITEAIVKLKIGDVVEHRVAEGDGPVDALDAALRRAIVPHYRSINDVQLVDYRVRVVNAKAATAARVRVIIQSRDHSHQWGTIGVSENIIDASWRALVDSIEYKLLREEDHSK